MTTGAARAKEREVSKPAFVWTRSETVALANLRCESCHGLGLTFGKRGAESPCRCVLRRVFRECLNEFERIQLADPRARQSRWDQVSTSRVSYSRRAGFSRKNEEFSADFVLVARRSLDAIDWRIFEMHFVQCADWRVCCKRLGLLNRGRFFHAVYRIEETLGRTFRELAPYALYPISEYYGYGQGRGGSVRIPVAARLAA